MFKPCYILFDSSLIVSKPIIIKDKYWEGERKWTCCTFVKKTTIRKQRGRQIQQRRRLKNNEYINFGRKIVQSYDKTYERHKTLHEIRF